MSKTIVTGNKKLSDNLVNVSYYSLFALLLSTPLVFSKWIESSFDLVKKSALIILGGIFVMFAIFYIIAKTYEKEQDGFKPLFDKRFDVFVLLFLAAAVASAVFSIKPYVSYNGQYERQIGLITYIYAIGVYFFASRLFRDSDRTDLTVRIMEVSAVMVALYAIIQFFGMDPFGAPLNAGTRPVSTMAHSIFAGGFMALVLPFSFIRIFKDEKPYAGLIFSFIICWGILLTQSRAAYVAGLAAVILVLILNPYVYKNTDNARFKKLFKINLYALAGIVTLIAVLFLALPNNPYTERLAQVLDLPKTARWLLWRDSFKAFWFHPLTGSGIATFSNMFEYVISYELKNMDPRNYYDHAHSVYIHTLCTMGILGLVTYVIFLFYGIISALRAYFNNDVIRNDRYLFLAVFSSLTGFSLFALADFEDTTILLYLFVILAMLKTVYNRYYDIRFSAALNEKSLNTISYARNVLFIVIMLYCNYNIYNIYNDLKADSYYREGKNKYFLGDIQSSIQSLNNAVITNYGCAEYKFTLASYVQDYCLKNPNISPEARNNLLNQAAQELERAKPNFFSHLQYKALLTLIQFQLGNKENAEKMRQEIFEKDSLIINFRNSLARYYFTINDYEKMRAELKVVFRFDPYNIDAVITSATYYMVVKDKERALMVCDNFLKEEPQNPLINELREQIKNAP